MMIKYINVINFCLYNNIWIYFDFDTIHLYTVDEWSKTDRFNLFTPNILYENKRGLFNFIPAEESSRISEFSSISTHPSRWMDSMSVYLHTENFDHINLHEIRIIISSVKCKLFDFGTE